MIIKKYVKNENIIYLNKENNNLVNKPCELCNLEVLIDLENPNKFCGKNIDYENGGYYCKGESKHLIFCNIDNLETILDSSYYCNLCSIFYSYEYNNLKDDNNIDKLKYLFKCILCDNILSQITN